MLRKLLKHEFRATARVMIPLYLITVLLAVLTRASALWAEMVTFDGMLGRNFLALLSGIIIFGFVLALIATFVVAVILAILRFRSNLMADEGYVMFTLPVSTHTLVWSKLIVSGMLLFAGVPMLDSMDGWLNSLTPATAIHGFMWGSILISAIYGAILYCITIRMLHRHLNLE